MKGGTRYHKSNCQCLACRAKRGEIRGEKSPMWGKKHSSQARKKMRLAKKGIIFTEEHKRNMKENHADCSGQNHPFYGKCHSEETKRKMGKTMIRLEHNKGKNNPNWKGGISFEPYGIEFNDKLKEKIRERDEHICQLCGSGIGCLNGSRHPIHHIDYDKKNNDELNLITLCDSCNGLANADRDKWQFFFETCQELRL